MDPVGSQNRNGCGLLRSLQQAQRALLQLAPKNGGPAAAPSGRQEVQAEGSDTRTHPVIRFPGAPAGVDREHRLERIRARIADGYYDRPDVRDGMARSLLRSFGQEE